jgi:cellulose synthase/poly-beta-1,6-N-acetylglucosamine synthase-like glycosyltransferase
MGTGMAFPWSTIREAPLASGHIVEDLQLGLDLAAAGTPPRFCPAALVTSMFPTRTDGIESQRTRWEHGHLGVIAKVGPRMLGLALRKGDGRLFSMALDLCVPPLATLALALFMLLAASALLAFAGVSLPLLVAGGMVTLLIAVVGLAWLAFGRNAVHFSEMLLAPLYAVRKVPMYLRMLRSRPVAVGSHPPRRPRLSHEHGHLDRHAVVRSQLGTCLRSTSTATSIASPACRSMRSTCGPRSRRCGMRRIRRRAA